MHPIFNQFGHTGPRRTDFLLDYSGAEFRGIWDNQPNIPAMPDDWKLPVPPIDEEHFEWIDLLEAVATASNEFVMLELGAGYGRWGIRGGAAARSRGLKTRLVFVEGEPKHAAWLREALALNDLSGVSTVHEAAIAYGGEPVPFLVDHDSLNIGFGQCIGWEGRGEPTGSEYYGQSIYRTPAGYRQIFVAPITLESVCAGLPTIDLIDMDLQKAELDLVRNSMDVLNAQVRRVHIGTHGHEIEHELRQTFTAAGWKKVWDFGCLRKNETPYGEVEFVDGVQGWINPEVG